MPGRRIWQHVGVVDRVHYGERLPSLVPNILSLRYHD